jgi:START domain-containing protein
VQPFVRASIIASLFALYALTTGAATASAADSPWEPVSNKDGITVARRKVEGSNLKEFLGRGVIDAPITRVLAVIRDADRRGEWMPNCGGAYLVEENMTTRTQLAYFRTKAPWPVSDRDSVNRAEMLVQPDKHRVYLPFEAIAVAKVPPVKGVVRMPFLRGHWILTPVEGGRATEAEYQVWANPGGSLPDWLANLASKTLPRETIAGLRRQVKKAEYPDFEKQIASSPEAKLLLGQ